MKKKFNSLSIAMPAFNEEKLLKKTVRYVLEILKSKKIIYEIIIVNDGSTDNTKRICDNLAKKNKNIIVIHHRKNLGLSSVFISALKRATKKNFMIINSDHSWPKSSIHRMLSLMGQTDFIIGYRTNILSNANFFRFINNLGLKLILKFLLFLPFKDAHGLFIAKLSDIKKIKFLNKVKNYKMGFTIFILTKLLKMKKNYIEVKTDVFDNSVNNSSVGNFKNTIYLLYFIVKLKLRLI